MERFIAIAIVVVIFLLTFTLVRAGERIRFYDESGGWAKSTGDYAEKQLDGSYRIYNQKGVYQGRLTKDRFYNKKGRVQEKFYLFPNR